MQTIDELIRRRVGDPRVGMVFSDRRWTHDEVVQAQADRAAILFSLREPGPFHVALLLDNVPEYVFWMGAAALAGAVLVGGNPTHRGDELARDLAHTECQLLVTSPPVPDPGRGVRPRPGPSRGPDPRHRRSHRGPPHRSDHPVRRAGVAGQRRPLSRTRPRRRSPRRRWACCCSPRGRRGPPRRACAARGAWPGSGPSWPRCSSSPRTMSVIWPCRSSTPTP